MIKKLFYLALLSLVIIGVLLLFENFDTKLFSFSDLDKLEIQANDESLIDSQLGFLFNHKISRLLMGKRVFILNRFLDKIAHPLDFSLYFGQGKFISYVFVPFLILGFLGLVRDFLPEIFFYFILSFSFSVFVSEDKSFLLYIPLVFTMILAGFLYLLRLRVK
ncbi:MAG: hypothetical protein KatS3mg088_431 [Patescibacteria group bacterium]|nr:MAG: hypothetical protein KatS3mg088_431 [Patescibacteria group bacterium]